MIKRHITLSVVTVVVGLTLLVAVSLQLYQAETAAIKTEFRKDVNKRLYSLEREIRISSEALLGLKGLYNEGQIPSEEQFARSTRDILARRMDIQALEWVPLVNHSNRLQFESSRQQLYPSFQITERQTQGRMIRAADRERYFPVGFVEPMLGNEEAFGFDLGSSEQRLKTLNAAADTGQLMVSSAVVLVQEHNQQKGILAVVPIYQGVPTTVANRREALSGYLVMVLRIPALFERSALSEKPLGIAMRLMDYTDRNASEQLHYHRSRTGQRFRGEMPYSVSLGSFGGRQWALEAAPTPYYFATRRSLTPYLVFAVGLCFIILIVVYQGVLGRRNSSVEQQVKLRTEELEAINRRLAYQSRTDSLTAVANRRYFDEILQKEWLRACRNKGVITLLIIDIDHFKYYNDSYGHIRGDECLQTIARLLRSCVGRPGDLLARYGGEEFAMILPDTSEKAVKVANRIVATVIAERIEHNWVESGFLSVSVGISTLHPTPCMESSELLEQADLALYQAKEAGRNCARQYQRGDKTSGLIKHM